MIDAPVLAEVWRGPFAESLHRGAWVAASSGGAIVDGTGDPDWVILPRSSAKPLQALPLIESGAARAAGLGPAQMALACASHQGAAIHTKLVREWLGRIERSEADLLCGIQPPRDARDRQALRDAGRRADQTHNNCSGKHSGFLTLARQLGAGPEYVDPTHPVQVAVREAFEDMTGAPTPGFGIDGCSAPNFATRLSGLARSMARFASAREDAPGTRERAAFDLRRAMASHPDLVAGEGRACTLLMRAMPGGAIVKTGAEGVFVAALPAQGIGIALKIADGATRAAEVAIAALLVRFGALDPAHPDAQALLRPPVPNRRGFVTGHIVPTTNLTG